MPTDGVSCSKRNNNGLYSIPFYKALTGTVKTVVFTVFSR